MKGENSLKILYTIEALYRKSDENTYITANDIIEYLKGYGITVDRKSIYGYINILSGIYGMDIEKDRKQGYLLLSRIFDLADLKMLADALCSSRFISRDKTKEIIEKLGKLTTEKNAKQLQREIFVENAVKSDNHSVPYNIDHIHKAINEDKRVTFKYFSFDVDFSSFYKFKKKYRTYDEGEHKGEIKIYEQSPFALVWKNENYYMLSYDDEKQDVRTFRVDKMENVEVVNKERAGSDVFKDIDIQKYANTAFSMFSGDKIEIELRVKNKLASVILDRFGNNIRRVHKSDDEHFQFCTEIQRSDMFFGWISGFGDGIEIVSPKDLREEYREYLSGVMKMYE
ncbi:MAG: WYL domain-containing protein [Clostridia bacterium]|nr:WYL domain-containing protein [Clostridia bacterium]